jgi:hypothetical protein
MALKDMASRFCIDTTFVESKALDGTDRHKLLAQLYVRGDCGMAGMISGICVTGGYRFLISDSRHAMSTP